MYRSKIIKGAAWIIYCLSMLTLSLYALFVVHLVANPLFVPAEEIKNLDLSTPLSNSEGMAFLIFQAIGIGLLYLVWFIALSSSTSILLTALEKRTNSVHVKKACESVVSFLPKHISVSRIIRLAFVACVMVFLLVSGKFIELLFYSFPDWILKFLPS